MEIKETQTTNNILSDEALDSQEQEVETTPQEQETQEAQAQDNVEQNTTPEPQELVLPETDEVPEKFRGKPVTELAKSYSELESMLGKIGSVFGGKDREEKSEALEELLGEKIGKAKSPIEFAQIMLETIEKRAAEIAEQKINEQFTQMTTEQQAQKEVEEVAKKYPQIEQDQEFASMVLGVVETQGITLTEAADKVAQKLGIQPATGNAEAVAKQNQNVKIEPENNVVSGTSNDEDEIHIIGGAEDSMPGLV